MKSELVTPAHLARRAVVYIRQSTPAQVVSHQESLRLQYALGQRAREFGWREPDIDVIDADLGLSGASAMHREGFKELATRVAERQYNKVDPDNRLVAAELERRWEAALIELQAADDALATRRAGPAEASAGLDRTWLPG